MKAREKYRDVPAAAQETFEWGAYAAAAARAAAGLSQSELKNKDPNDNVGSKHQGSLEFSPP